MASFELLFYWFILTAIIYRKIKAHLGDLTNWLLVIFWCFFSKKCLDLYRLGLSDLYSIECTIE